MIGWTGQARSTAGSSTLHPAKKGYKPLEVFKP